MGQRTSRFWKSEQDFGVILADRAGNTAVEITVKAYSAFEKVCGFAALKAQGSEVDGSRRNLKSGGEIIEVILRYTIDAILGAKDLAGFQGAYFAVVDRDLAGAGEVSEGLSRRSSPAL